MTQPCYGLKKSNIQRVFRPWILLLTLGTLCLGPVLTPRAKADSAKLSRSPDLVVFAALGLKDVLPQLGRLWTESHTETSKVMVAFQFGPMPQLIQQLREGARADVFIGDSLSATHVLVQAGILLPPSVRVLTGDRLVLASPGAYTGAVAKAGSHPKYGTAFLDFLLSGVAQREFAKAGFVRPSRVSVSSKK